MITTALRTLIFLLYTFSLRQLGLKALRLLRSIRWGVELDKMTVCSSLLGWREAAVDKRFLQIQITFVVECLGEDLKDASVARPSESSAETGGGTLDTTNSGSVGRPTEAPVRKKPTEVVGAAFIGTHPAGSPSYNQALDLRPCARRAAVAM
jgi:hypothetical protein